MSAPYYTTGQNSASGSPYRPGTADGSWDQSRPSTLGETRQDMYAQLPSDSTSSQLRPEPLQPTQQAAVGGVQMGAYLGQNVVTPRQSAFSRDQIDGPAHFGAPGGMDSFDHGTQGVMPADTPRAAHFGGSSVFDPSKMSMAGAHTFAHATTSAWPNAMQQHSDAAAYSRYAYPTQTGTSSWSNPGGMSMSHNVIYDTSSSSANTSPNRSQTYYDMSGDQFDHSAYGSHIGAHTYPMYGASTSKMGGSGAYVASSQSEYPPEEIDSMLNQVSTLYKTANTKKMAEFYRDKWARMWLTCNYTLKPSIQISIPRTILHESYRRACDSFGLEPLQAASFGKVLRSQFPDVAQRRLGGRGKTRFHYCGFGTSNEREAVKVKSLLEDEKAGRLQLSAGLSAEYASEARAKARSEGQDVGESSYRNHPSSEASPVEQHSSRSGQYDNSPHASSESSNMGNNNPGVATDDRLIASAFATLNSSVLTPPGTSSGTTYGSRDAAARYSQVQSQNLPHAAHSSADAGAGGGGGGGAGAGAGGGMPRRHTVSHSYSGLSDMSFLPSHLHPSSETGDSSVMHSGDVSAFGPGSVSGISEPTQSGSLLNSPASSLHGYHYVQDLRHVSSSIPFRRSCQELPDWPTLPEHSSSNAANPTYATTSTNATTTTTTSSANPTGTHPSQETRKAWREYESLCQALLYSIYLGPDPISFEQRTISFWNSLNPVTRDTLHNDSILHSMVLRADGIIFRQLLVKLDGMIGDDVADERLPGLRSLARMLAEQMDGLVKDALPEMIKMSKVQASQKMAESLERIVKIFEAIKMFREESMLDVVTDAMGGWHASETVSRPSTSAGGGVGTPSLALGLRNPSLRSAAGSSPRSGTQSSLSSLAGPLANFHLRRRDNSVSSTLSDSQSTWANESHQQASSCLASESELSSSVDQSQVPNNFYAPLARKPTRSDASASSGISTTFGSLALAMPQLHTSPQTMHAQQPGFMLS